MKICIWTGPAWEPWGPQSIDSGGIGGSETACVHTASQLAKLGHEVDTFGQHDQCEGLYDGVRYFHFKRAVENRKLLDADVWISSRDKNAIKLEPNARLKILWAHDVHCGEDWDGSLLKFDSIFCLSKWAAETFAGFYPHRKNLRDKIWVTQNGIDTSRYRSIFKIPFEINGGIPKFFSSSAPDRGLEVLLNMWPKIREIRSDAELHVYYGFDTWKKMVEKSPSKVTSLRIAWFVEKLKSLADMGVYYHGRVGQRELAQAQLDSVLWLHPTAFAETSCITAMEAQAAGAVPVTTRLAALAETVKHGILLDGPNTAESYEAGFLGMVRGLLGPSNGLRLELASKGRQWALAECDWSTVAKKWDTFFKEKLEKLEKMP